jgi:hypothetical protein
MKFFLKCLSAAEYRVPRQEMHTIWKRCTREFKRLASGSAEYIPTMIITFVVLGGHTGEYRVWAMTRLAGEAGAPRNHRDCQHYPLYPPGNWAGP